MRIDDLSTVYQRKVDGPTVSLSGDPHPHDFAVGRGGDRKMLFVGRQIDSGMDDSRYHFAEGRTRENLSRQRRKKVGSAPHSHHGATQNRERPKGEELPSANRWTKPCNLPAPGRTRVRDGPHTDPVLIRGS
jgi:hypothetical protein